MSKTLRELIEWLKNMDEITLLERLDISSEELAERFIDKIENDFDDLEQEMEEETEEE